MRGFALEEMYRPDNDITGLILIGHCISTDRFRLNVVARNFDTALATITYLQSHVGTTTTIFSMSLLFPSAYSCLHKPHGRCSCFPPLVSGCLKAGMKIARRPNTGFVYSEGSKERFERIRNLFSKVELSVSSYDTAWLALVPSPTSSGNPCFPECVDWLLNNQLGDGSWGPSHHRLLIKDALSSTLASVIALKRWGLGDEQINIGLHFIEMNITSAIDENQYSPIGFDIIFPGMLEYAKDLNLNLPFEPKDLDAMLHRRDLELRRTAYRTGEEGMPLE
ncbi:Ent-kaurene synthase [Bertholletia excelsa]